MKNNLKKTLLGLPFFERACRRLTAAHVRTIMYHRFSTSANDDPRQIDAAMLEIQAAMIADHHARWTPDDHLAAITGARKPVTGCPVVVTCDDGYRDFYQVAFPIFKKHGIPVMLFVTTGFVDGKIWFWWDKLEYILMSAKQQSLKITFGGCTFDLDLERPEGRKAAWHALGDRCRFLPDDVKEQSLQELSRDLDVVIPQKAPAGYDALTWDELRAMHSDGLLVGAHTVHHPILSRLDPAAAREEIVASKRQLNDQLDEPISWFCYPQGGPADYTKTIAQEVSQAGYLGCYLAYQASDHPDDPFTMPRYCVADDIVEFRWMLCGAEYLVRCMKSLLGCHRDYGDAYWNGADPECRLPESGNE